MASPEHESADNLPRQSSEDVPHLSRQDIDKLTTYKWRYTLESHGFNSQQAARLLFMRWLYYHGAARG